MKVYVVTIGWRYEGDQIIGLYSTLEAADRRAQAEREKTPQTCDWADVNEWEVDAANPEPVDCASYHRQSD